MGIQLPTIEVRFERLRVEADVHVGKRALPSVPNFMLTLLEVILSTNRKERFFFWLWVDLLQVS